MNTANEKTLETSPNQNNGGNLPSGYDKILFTLKNGDYTPDIRLPEQAAHGNIVDIRSYATLSTSVKIKTLTDDTLNHTLRTNETIVLVYDAGSSIWLPQAENIYYSSSLGNSLPRNVPDLSAYIIDSEIVGEINLPDTASDRAILIIACQQDITAAIEKSRLIYKSSTEIRQTEAYFLTFFKVFNQWGIHSSSVRNVRAIDVPEQLPAPASRTLQVNFSNGNHRPAVKLPQRPGDRDKIILQSTATWPVEIDRSNVNPVGRMVLTAGDRYEFLFVAERSRWQLLSSPDTVLQAKDIASGNVPTLTHPRTIIQARNGNWQATLYLPEPSLAGSRIIVDTRAELPFTIKSSTTQHTINKNEIVCFKVGDDGKWFRETVTIDLLLLFSDQSSTAPEQKIMEDRLLEGLELANEALENSGANFRFRNVGVRMIPHKPGWIDYDSMIRVLRDDPDATKLRKELKADGMYFEDKSVTNIGKGWIKASAYNMVAIGGGRNVMRHELGHNMGLDHGLDPFATIMAGNALPYFSTPGRYLPNYGIPLVTPGDTTDGVAIMNSRSSLVANFSNEWQTDAAVPPDSATCLDSDTCPSCRNT